MRVYNGELEPRDVFRFFLHPDLRKPWVFSEFTEFPASEPRSLVPRRSRWSEGRFGPWPQRSGHVGTTSGRPQWNHIWIYHEISGAAKVEYFHIFIFVVGGVLINNLVVLVFLLYANSMFYCIQRTYVMLHLGWIRGMEPQAPKTR